MQRSVAVVVLVAMFWVMFGAHEATWARQDPAKTPTQQREVAEEVRFISPGTELKVFLTGRRVLVGTLEAVEADAIVVKHKKDGGTTRVTFGEIEKLQAKEKGHRTITYVVVGVVAAVGALIVLAAATCNVSPSAQQRG